MSYRPHAGGGKDRRGNVYDRAARKIWMLKHFGNGVTCPCAHCGETLTKSELEADRIIPGGSYRRDNIIPACGPCNSARSNTPLPPKFFSVLRKISTTEATDPS